MGFLPTQEISQYWLIFVALCFAFLTERKTLLRLCCPDGEAGHDKEEVRPFRLYVATQLFEPSRILLRR